MLNTNIRVDLHIHSKISEYKDGDIVKDSIIENIDTLLSKLNEHNITLFGFSDHNRFDSELFIKTRELIRSDANKNKYPSIKNILPVVEFDVIFETGKKKCHVLAVFDLDTEEELKRLQKTIETELLKSKTDAYSKDKFDELIRAINTDVLLIAAQRKSLDNQSGSKNSLSDSVSNVYEFLKVGYISALEIQKSAVHGMILKNLVDFPRTISFTSGSDCHQWNSYPKHDETEKMEEKSFYFTIKAQPTFSGLVMAFTSPNSRFNRVDRINYNYIQNIVLNGNVFPLSFGINTIIGENGSGKSSIVYGLLDELKGSKTSYAGKILKNNEFKSSPNNLSTSIFGVRQSEIIDNENKGFMFGNKSDYFNDIDNSAFETKVSVYATNLLKAIENNISLANSTQKIKNTSFELNIGHEDKKQYYFQITFDTQFTNETNRFDTRLEILNSILELIKEEYKQDVYTNVQKAELRNAFNVIYKVRNEISEKYLNDKLTIEVKNIIAAKVNDYTTDTNAASGDTDRQISMYNLSKNAVKDAIIEHISKINTCRWSLKDFPKNLKGKSMKSHRGYSFNKIAKYAQEDPEVKFFEKVFNKDYRTLDKLKAIITIDDLVKALSNAKADNYKKVYKDKTDTYIKDMEEEQFFITKIGESKNIGNTLGEKSLVFFDFISHNDNDKPILLIDQPEDNISNKKILEKLINNLSLLRDKKQIIIVTHNPLLVVNLDADNVIHLSNNNGIISSESGCLEKEGIIPLIAETMDGGIDAIERRYKIYGRK